MEIRSRSRKRNRTIGILLLAVSAFLAVYALWPTSYRTETFPIRSDLLPQAYVLEVRYPRFGPSGEIVTVDAALKPEGEDGNWPPAGEASPVIVAEIQSADIALSPDGQISTPLQQGKPVHFTWSALASSGGGSLNIFLFKSGAQEADGVYVQQPVWARVFPYTAFPGPQGLKFPLIFFAVFGGVFGLGFLIMNTLGGSDRHPGLRARAENKIR